MRLPWHNQTGIAKLATILATICILSFGLCTASAITYPANSGARQILWNVCTWTFAGTVVVTLLALLLTGLFAIVQSLRRSRR
jgi:threonine/homoserine/homoserine lactone efflux protein